jgi:OmcA/MtrC family decaheme c-type cytochrome
MTFGFSPRTAFRLCLALVVLMGSAALISKTTGPFTTADKAFYLDEASANFIRPGLKITITGATIAPDGTVQASFTLADPKGQPLDRDGIVTPGTISTSFIAAYIPQGQKQYTAYTTRTQTSPITSQTATQAGTDSGGTYAKVADGSYTYTFKTKAANMDPTVTHTIGVYGSRNLTEFDLGTNYFDATFNFVPNGSAVTVTRDVIQSATCNKCHQQLAFHGGARRSMELCVLCHTPQSIDPDTGNTVDLKVMAHKIHMGSDLPSVKTGTPYQIIGFGQSVNDYSDVAFPADARRCQACHGQDNAAQKDAYLSNPSRAACGACHDNVNFATGENHVDLPQISDNQCANCHQPEGELEFDASIKGAHQVPEQSRDLGGVNFEIQKVENNSAGQKPVVTFDIKDKYGNRINLKDMTRIGIVLAGSTKDYTAFTTGYVSENGLTATGAGPYTYTFTNAIPATATGTFTIGFEGYRNATLLLGTKKQMTVRDAALNKQVNISVDGSAIVARRTVVSLDSCNKCHSFLSLHGGNRNQIEQCVLCHNPVENDASVRPAGQSPAESIDFALMVHRIHSGPSQTRDYIVYGRGGSLNQYNDVGYPQSLTNCSACHVGGSEGKLLENLSLVNDTRGLINPVGTNSGACLGCHTTIAAASHALTNTSVLGEACGACHGANAEFSVTKVHAQ